MPLHFKWLGVRVLFLCDEALKTYLGIFVLFACYCELSLFVSRIDDHLSMICLVINRLRLLSFSLLRKFCPFPPMFH